MPFLRKPSAERVRTFLASQSGLEFTYAHVGATRTSPPSDYVVDHTRVRIGTGEETFELAKAAIGRWEQFRLGWVQAWSPHPMIAEGAEVAVFARIARLWWLNACRVVYLVDEQTPARRFGFAYGTLPGHAESGEERFLVEQDPSDGDVWYDILAFSRPRHPLARLAYPLTRRLQKRFARDSVAAMKGSVRSKLKETGDR